jgi:hypothetical protein
METLLVIDVVTSAGVILLQTVWATTADLRAGRRRTDVERIADPALNATPAARAHREDIRADRPHADGGDWQSRLTPAATARGRRLR